VTCTSSPEPITNTGDDVRGAALLSATGLLVGAVRPVLEGAAACPCAMAADPHNPKAKTQIAGRTRIPAKFFMIFRDCKL
jgi:hypothetical protein